MTILDPKFPPKTFAVDDETDEMLRSLCQEEQRNKSQMIRWLIREEWKRRNPNRGTLAAVFAPIPADE